jgi:circadian clock protein KaiB
MVEYELILFVAGESASSKLAVENVRAIFEGLPHTKVAIEIIDVFLSPDRAIADGIFATPTLVLASPLPERRVIGDFANKEMVLQKLA